MEYQEQDGFFRIGAATPHIRPADCAHNGEAAASLLRLAAENGVQALVLPELCLTGSTCQDLFFSTPLLRGAEEALTKLIKDTAGLPVLAVVGVPVPWGGALYNCGAVFCGGKLLGLAAKTSLPNHGACCETRYFTPAPRCVRVSFCGQEAFLGGGLIFRWKERPLFTMGAELGEDIWAARDGKGLAQSGACLILSPYADGETAGAPERRRAVLRSQSARLHCAYARAGAGAGESTTDLAFSGHNIIAENGALLAEGEPFEDELTCADVDLELLMSERRSSSLWSAGEEAVEIPFSMEAKPFSITRGFSPYPFVPKDEAALSERCAEVLNIQAHGLAGRMGAIGAKTVVLGLSGGLDSSLALLVCARAFKLLSLPALGIRTVSMPGFGTTGRTKNNACALAEQLGAGFAEIPIGAAVLQHFKDIGQDENLHDVTYENAQARERTQILMDIANQCGGLVVGTGDLSELALGWATYNGDHMSMYAVNAGVPKTLVRHLVAFAAKKAGGTLCATLNDVLVTPVSPELLPPLNGEIVQKTEDLVGPYELHDFFLYYTLRFGFGAGKILRMAQAAFPQRPVSEIEHWLSVFCRRFFSQQFKRSCMPDGPKIGSVGLSPRGDWRMPSDASAALWRAVPAGNESQRK